MNKNFIELKLEKKYKNSNTVVHTRFPPEPNSPSIHLGHCKSLLLNYSISEKYGGLFNIRFDDSNPLTVDEGNMEGMLSDIKWLGYPVDRVFYASDYFKDIISVCRFFILSGDAYVDFSTSEEIAEMKGTPTRHGINNKYRSSDPFENRDIFDKMVSGEITNAVVRAKIDMSSDNMLMRDPVIMRCISAPHHRTGDKFKIYPMYDFAHPICDMYEEVTDSLCTLEFEVHRPLYNWVIDNLIKDYHIKPEQTEFNRLNITNNILSKRKIKELIDNKLVSGWDDPRLLTVKGLRRRGYTPDSLKVFCEKAGWTKRNSLTDYKLLEACLREELNKSANRYMGVIDPIKLTITNWDKDVEWVVVDNNPEDGSAGNRTVAFNGQLYIERDDFKPEANKKYNRLTLGGEVRLKGGYVVKAVSYDEDDYANVTEVFCTYDPLTKSGMPMERKVKGTIHWVARDYAVDAEIRDYGLLFNDEKVDDNSEINPESLVMRKAYVELDCLNLYNNPTLLSAPIQFMRKGYYILDKDSTDEKLVFNKTVSLKEGW